MITNDLKVTTVSFELPSGMPTSMSIDQVFPTKTKVIPDNIEIGGDLPNGGSSPLPLNRLKFVGNDQTKASRRTQGIAQKGRYIFNSWYFRDGTNILGKKKELTKYQDNFKLSVVDTQDNSFVNLVPVQLDSAGNEFVHIDSHAGGIAIIDHYLYIAGGKYIRVFDINNLFKVEECEDQIKSNQKFIREYTYMIPEVGRMDFKTPGNASLSYLSIAILNAKKYFLAGNFYSKKDKKYTKGGKSMIWLLPVKEFPSIKGEGGITQTYHQIEPLFPSGSNKDSTVTRIQGALIRDNTLMINRSYAKETMQLLVIEYKDILASTHSSKIVRYFSGTNGSSSDKRKYNHENWIYGCEDLTLTSDNKLLTVSEFKDSRYIYSASFEDIQALMA